MKKVWFNSCRFCIMGSFLVKCFDAYWRLCYGCWLRESICYNDGLAYHKADLLVKGING